MTSPGFFLASAELHCNASVLARPRYRGSDCSAHQSQSLLPTLTAGVLSAAVT